MNSQTNRMITTALNMLNRNMHNKRKQLNFPFRTLLLAAGFALITAGCGGDGSGSSSDSITGTSTGTGGSTARMTIDGDFLYAISSSSEVQLFDITQPADPLPVARVPIGRNIETLFPFGDYLLIGAEAGMFIMDNRDRRNPQFLSEFTHARARDPVVAHEGYAYVTLRSDGFGFANQMDVVNINDINNPTLERTIAMQSPSGLTVGVTDNGSFREELYVCDDVAGIKIFDLTDNANPTVVDTIRDVNCNDVIAANGILYVITDNSLIQYDYTQSPPVRLSVVTESAG